MSLRILVVEDEPLLALDVADILTDSGFTVIGPAATAATGLALLDRFDCHAAVLDIKLGNETSAPIAALLTEQSVPFVLLTGWLEEQVPEEFRGVPLLVKPIRPTDLVARLRTFEARRVAA